MTYSALNIFIEEFRVVYDDDGNVGGWVMGEMKSEMNTMQILGCVVRLGIRLSAHNIYFSPLR